MTNPNDLAFSTDAKHEYTRGLTKREYFSAMALQGILASREIQTSAMFKMDKEWTANEALCHADALIARLNKKE